LIRPFFVILNRIKSVALNSDEYALKPRSDWSRGTDGVWNLEFVYWDF